MNNDNIPLMRDLNDMGVSSDEYRINFIGRLLIRGVSIDVICKTMNLSVDDVNNLRYKFMASNDINNFIMDDIRSTALKMVNDKNTESTRARALDIASRSIVTNRKTNASIKLKSTVGKWLNSK